MTHLQAPTAKRTDEREDPVCGFTQADVFLCVDLVVLQACIDGSMEMVTFLVEREASVNRADSEGWTPLHVAASCGHPDIAEWVENTAYYYRRLFGALALV